MNDRTEHDDLGAEPLDQCEHPVTVALVQPAACSISLVSDWRGQESSPRRHGELRVVIYTIAAPVLARHAAAAAPAERPRLAMAGISQEATPRSKRWHVGRLGRFDHLFRSAVEGRLEPGPCSSARTGNGRPPGLGPRIASSSRGGTTGSRTARCSWRIGSGRTPAGRPAASRRPSPRWRRLAGVWACAGGSTALSGLLQRAHPERATDGCWFLQ